MTLGNELPELLLKVYVLLILSDLLLFNFTFHVIEEHTECQLYSEIIVVDVCSSFLAGVASNVLARSIKIILVIEKKF